MCDLRHDLVLAPLPARRQLWEANDGLKWQSEINNNPSLESNFGLDKTGELVRVDASQLHHSGTSLSSMAYNDRTSSDSGNWEEWCAGMDSFGGLVMLAASFVV